MLLCGIIKGQFTEVEPVVLQRVMREEGGGGGGGKKKWAFSCSNWVAKMGIFMLE